MQIGWHPEVTDVVVLTQAEVRISGFAAAWLPERTYKNNHRFILDAQNIYFHHFMHPEQKLFCL